MPLLVAHWSRYYNYQKILGLCQLLSYEIPAPGSDGNSSSYLSLWLGSLGASNPCSRAISYFSGTLTLAFSTCPQACNYPLELYEVSGAETWNGDSFIPVIYISLPRLSLYFYTHQSSAYSVAGFCC